MAFPAWASDPSSLLITEQEYQALPPDAARSIEVAYGRVVFREPRPPEQQCVSRNLTTAFLNARPATPCTYALRDADMRYRRSPDAAGKGERFTLRRPDVVVLRCLQPDALLCSADVLVAVEITSSADDMVFSHKRAEYAAQAIPAYLIVLMTPEGIDSIEEHRLAGSGRNYQLTAVHRDSLNTELPETIKLDVSFATLEAAS